MTSLVPIHVLILHPIHRTHVTNLCGKIFAELVSEQKNTRGEMRNLNGLRVEPRLHLRAGKRIVDVAELNPDVGIRQESRVLRRLILRRGGAGMSQEYQGRDRPKNSLPVHRSATLGFTQPRGRPFPSAANCSCRKELVV